MNVLLVDPKFPHNVGGALRACAAFGARELAWTGERVADNRELAPAARVAKKKWRLPREERIKAYQHVRWGIDEGALDHWITDGMIPVAVEVLDYSESLVDFVHPEEAVYVFGPEDGGIPKGVRALCHRFVTIPSQGCLNLSAAVNVVLYDRTAKITTNRKEPAWS